MGERSCGFWFWLAVVSGRLCPPRPRGGAFGLSHPAAGLSRRWRAGLGCRPFPAVFAVLTGGPASGGIPCRMSNEPDSLLKPREIMFRTITLTGLAALLAATALTVATPAQAQIGTIFSDPPPLRPPGSIPRGGQPQPQPTPDGDEVVTEPPAQKIVNKKATFSGLDKITGRIINFDEDIGETVQFGALRVKTDACYTRPATEATNTDAFVEVDEITLQGEVKRIFSGWMYAASPGLHGVEHPIYDIWLTDCKVPDTTMVSAQPDTPKPAPPAAQKRAPPKQAQRPPPQPQFQPPPQEQPPPPPPQRQPGLFPFGRCGAAGRAGGLLPAPRNAL